MNEQLEQLESQLAETPFAKRIGLYITIILSFIVASWYLFGETSYTEIETKKDSIYSLESKLQKNNKKVLEKITKKTKIEILTLEEEITNIKYKDKFIQAKLESLGFVIFNEIGIAQILDDILKNSLKNYIDIELINSTQINQAEGMHIVEKEQIEISGSSSFKNIVSLVQYIDSLNALIKIKNISIYLDSDKTNFDVNISHYGVEL